MKKLLALMLAAALALSLAACGGDSGAGDTNTPSTPSGGNGDTTSTDTPSVGGDSTSEETSKPQSLKVGDTYTSDKFEITLTNVEFADKLNTDCTSENFMFPYEDGKGAIWAEDGNILLIFSFTYHFIGKEEFEDVFRTLGVPCVSYGDGYVFGDSRTGDTNLGIFAKEAEEPYWHILTHSVNMTLHRILGFEEDKNGSIKVDLTTEVGRLRGQPYINDTYQPLDKSTYECRGFISVPLEVYENTDEPLSISFNILGGDFTIR